MAQHLKKLKFLQWALRGGIYMGRMPGKVWGTAGFATFMANGSQVTSNPYLLIRTKVIVAIFALAGIGCMVKGYNIYLKWYEEQSE
ncbi:hypothetical protein ACFL2A_00725 [Thermodesulfobacteriota bacterium]